MKPSIVIATNIRGGEKGLSNTESLMTQEEGASNKSSSSNSITDPGTDISEDGSNKSKSENVTVNVKGGNDLSKSLMAPKGGSKKSSYSETNKTTGNSESETSLNLMTANVNIAKDLTKSFKSSEEGSKKSSTLDQNAKSISKKKIIGDTHAEGSHSKSEKGVNIKGTETTPFGSLQRH